MPCRGWYARESWQENGSGRDLDEDWYSLVQRSVSTEKDFKSDWRVSVWLVFGGRVNTAKSHVLPPEVGILQLVSVQGSRDVDVFSTDADHFPLQLCRLHSTRYILWVLSREPLSRIISVPIFHPILEHFLNNSPPQQTCSFEKAAKKHLLLGVYFNVALKLVGVSPFGCWVWLVDFPTVTSWIPWPRQDPMLTIQQLLGQDWGQTWSCRVSDCEFAVKQIRNHVVNTIRISMGIEIHKNWHAKSFICLKSQHWSLKSNNFFSLVQIQRRPTEQNLHRRISGLLYHFIIKCLASHPVHPVDQALDQPLPIWGSNVQANAHGNPPQSGAKKKLRVGETMQDQTLLFLTLPAPWRTCFFSTTWNRPLPRRLLSRLWAEPLHPAMIVGKVSWCIIALCMFFSKFNTQPLQYHTQCPLSKRKMWKLHQEKWIPTVPDSHPFRKSMEIFRMQGPFFATPPAQLLINLTHSPQTPRSSSHLLTVSQPSWPGQEIAKTHRFAWLLVAVHRDKRHEYRNLSFVDSC